MKRLFLAVSMLAASTAGGLAGDLAARQYAKASAAVAQVTNWTGFYVGVQGEYGWGSSNEVFLGAPNNATNFATQKYKTSGSFVGEVAGYNWQTGAVVLGIEGDYHWTDINGRSSEINVGATDTYYTKLRSFGDIKGRLGYAAGPALFFVSGGGAVGDLQHRYESPLLGAAGLFIQNTIRWGYTVGAGVEYLFAESWSGKLEYNYIDLGKSAIKYPGGGPLNRSEWSDTFHTIKVGINYHFNSGGPVVARY